MSYILHDPAGYSPVPMQCYAQKVLLVIILCGLFASAPNATKFGLASSELDLSSMTELFRKAVDESTPL